MLDLLLVSACAVLATAAAFALLRWLRARPLTRLGTLGITAAIWFTTAAVAWRLASLPGLQLLGHAVSRVETEHPWVALTFDDGPTRKYAPDILDVLREEGVHATFFVTGAELKAAPE